MRFEKVRLFLRGPSTLGAWQYQAVGCACSVLNVEEASVMRVDRPWIARAAVAAALVFCLGLVQACRCRDSGSGDVATVDGHPIPFSEFWEEFKNRYDDVADLSTLHPDVLLLMKAEVLRDLVRWRLLLEEARQRGIRVSEEALSARMVQIRNGYTGPMFQKILLEYRQDPEQFRRAVTEQLVMEALYREVTAGVEAVSEDEIRAYYDENLDEFLVPETVWMRQLIVQDRDVARKLLGKLRGRGEDFPALAAEHSRLPGIENPGGLESYRRGDLPEALEDSAFSAEVGRVAGPVETPYGVHLIRVENRIPGHLPSLDDVREEIRVRLEEERREQTYAGWIQTRVLDADIRVHPSMKDAMLGP
jgi:peptidyl-prolyl cis-trans isomerase C